MNYITKDDLARKIIREGDVLFYTNEVLRRLVDERAQEPQALSSFEIRQKTSQCIQGVVSCYRGIAGLKALLDLYNDNFQSPEMQEYSHAISSVIGDFEGRIIEMMEGR